MKIIKKTVIISFLAGVGLFLSSVGFADEQTISDHPHYFPYTKVLAEEYHLRLDVDHPEGKMYLVFEDISEKAVRIMPLKTITAEILLPEGETRMVEFKEVKEESARTRREPLVYRLNKRRAGRFEVSGDWIRTTPDFDIIVSFPFRGKDYKFVFDYSTGGNMFPYHMKR